MTNLLEILTPRESLESKLKKSQNLETFTSLPLRKDDRSLYTARKLFFRENVISKKPKSHSISMQKGKTSIITSLSFEVTTTKSNEPVGHTGGYVIPNIEMHCNANPIMKPGGKPLENIQVLNSLISQVLNVKQNDRKFMPENCLSIAGAENNYCLVCFIDISILCDDGGILDLAMLSIAKLFRNGFEIPLMKYDRNIGQLYSTNEVRRVKSNEIFLPLSLTFSIFQSDKESFLFLDPTFEEALLSENNLLIIFGTVCGEVLLVEQMGQGLEQDQYFDAVKVAKTHFIEVGEKFLKIGN